MGDGAGPSIHANMKPTRFPSWTVSVHSELGTRKRQEDRFAVCPRLFSDDEAFFGVFDGTAGDFATEFIHTRLLEHVKSSPSFQAYKAALRDGSMDKEQLNKLTASAMRQGFLSGDAELIQEAARAAVHYSSTTCVAVLISSGVATCAHVGDSRIALGKVAGNRLYSEFLTADHKPNTPAELQRIEQAGGSCIYLHGGKPFIRGGDFTRRQQQGERPMQLNYSRAFGGKDLKMFGLSVEPDVVQFQLGPEHRVLVLASDGVWDVVTAEGACQIALESHSRNRNPSRDVVTHALQELAAHGMQDNVTALVVIFTNGEPSVTQT